jgi:hypothetical protein
MRAKEQPRKHAKPVRAGLTFSIHRSVKPVVFVSLPITITLFHERTCCTDSNQRRLAVKLIFVQVKILVQADPADSGIAISAAACTKQMGIAAAQSGDAQSAAKYFHDALALVEPALSEPAPSLEALYTAVDA